MYFVFDGGGTSLRLAVSEDGKTLARKKVIPTPAHFADGLKALVAGATELSEGAPLRGIVGGIAGVLQPDHQALRFAPNLADWVNKPLGPELNAKLRAPVSLQNDAALGALGEVVFGAGKGKKIVAYIAVGTGVGGARIVYGKIDASSFGFEPGQHVVDGGQTLEQLVVRSDNPAKWLAQGLVNTVVFWSPEIIVLGGGVVHRGDIALTDVARHFKTCWRMPFDPPLVVSAMLGDESGLYGALAYGRSLR